MMKDPVCGMMVDEKKAATPKSEYEGQTFYFCSASCKKKFDSDPQRYVHTKA